MPTKVVPAVVLALSLLLGAAGCSSSDVSKSKFESNLVKGTKDSVTKADAKCITDKVYAAFPQKDINKLYTADKQSDLSKSVYSKFTTIVADCAKAS